MKQTPFLIGCMMITTAVSALAADSDPGYGPDRPRASDGGRMIRRDGDFWNGGRAEEFEYYNGGDDARLMIPRYYRPMQRFYGSGYTVSYHYIPVYRTDYPHTGPIGESSNFPTASTHLTPAQVAAFGNNLPRVTQRDDRSIPRAPVTSIVRKKPTGKPSRKSKSENAPVENPGNTPSKGADAVPESTLPAEDEKTPAPAGGTSHSRAGATPAAPAAATPASPAESSPAPASHAPAAKP